MRLHRPIFVTILLVGCVIVNYSTSSAYSLISINKLTSSITKEFCTTLICTENHHSRAGLTTYNSSLHSSHVRFISPFTSPILAIETGTVELMSCSIYLRDLHSRGLYVSMILVLFHLKLAIPNVRSDARNGGILPSALYL